MKAAGSLAAETPGNLVTIAHGLVTDPLEAGKLIALNEIERAKVTAAILGDASVEIAVAVPNLMIMGWNLADDFYDYMRGHCPDGGLHTFDGFGFSDNNNLLDEDETRFSRGLATAGLEGIFGPNAVKNGLDALKKLRKQPKVPSKGPSSPNGGPATPTGPKTPPTVPRATPPTPVQPLTIDEALVVPA